MPAEPAVPPSAPPRRAPPGLALFAAALAEHLGVDAIDDLDSVLALAGTADMRELSAARCGGRREGSAGV